MKKFLIMMVCLLTASQAMAQNRTLSNMTEAQLLGITAGTALACNAGAKLDDFELIANRYIANQAVSDAAEMQGYREYGQEKLKTYQEQKKDPQLTCGEVLDSFNRLPIFKTVVYADGSIKTPDGKIIKARKPVKALKKDKPKKKTQAKKKTTKKTTSKQKSARKTTRQSKK